MSNAIGPDVSFYQGVIDFLKMVNNGAKYVVIRAGQNYWLDNKFSTNWKAAKAAGLPRGSYWFYDSRSTPQSQAMRWFNVLGGDYGELPLFADYEEKYGGAYGSSTHFYTFLQELERLMPGKEIIIYTGYYFWRERVLSVDRPKFAKYGLWIARYGASSPLIPPPWKIGEWDFWQYTDKGDGHAYGVDSYGIDLNYYNGTVTEFEERFSLGEPEPPPVEPPPVEPPPAEETLYRMTESDGSFCFVPVEDEEPEEPVEMQLVRKEGKLFCVIHQIPDLTASNKIQLDFIEGATVNTLSIPKYRTMMREDGTTHEVPNYETDADFSNLNEVWAFLPIQEVQKSNGNFRMLHNAWTDSGSKGNWDTKGSYILREYLKEIGTPEPPVVEPPVPPEPISYDDPADDPNWVAIKPPLENFPTPNPDYINPDLLPADPDYQTPDNFVRWYPEPEYIPRDGYTWVQYNRDTSIRHGEDVPQTATMMIRDDADTKWIEKELWLQCAEEMQWHIWYNVVRDNPGRSHDYHLWAFRQFMANHKWVTDLQDYDNHTNFVLAHFVDPVKYNLAKNDPFWFKVSLSTKENLWRGEFDGSVFVAQCLDYNNYPDPSQWSALYDERHLAQHCTQTTTRKRADGTIITINFPHGRCGALQANGKREKTRTTWFNIYPGGHIGIAKVHLTVLPNGSGPHWRVNLDRPNPYI